MTARSYPVIRPIPQYPTPIKPISVPPPRGQSTPMVEWSTETEKERVLYLLSNYPHLTYQEAVLIIHKNPSPARPKAKLKEKRVTVKTRPPPSKHWEEEGALDKSSSSESEDEDEEEEDGEPASKKNPGWRYDRDDDHDTYSSVFQNEDPKARIRKELGIALHPHERKTSKARHHVECKHSMP